jgi:DNA-binding transcriptional LysR family regulator
MKPSLGQIEAFYWIARLGSFRKAASFLNLTQPTITLRIRALEAAAGARLFDRTRRQIRLTSAGAALLPRADRMMALAEEFGSRSVENDPLRGRLRLGAPDSFGLTCMSQLLRSLRDQCPDLEIALTVDNSAVLSQQLNERILDVAFIADPKVDTHVKTELLGTMELAWIAGGAFSLPQLVTPSDLVDHDIITNAAPANLMTIVLNWFGSAGLRPARLSTCNSLSVMLRLTAAATGVAILPTAILQTDPEMAHLRVLQAQPEIPRQRFYAAYLDEKSGPGLRTAIFLARQAVSASNLLA